MSICSIKFLNLSTVLNFLITSSIFKVERKNWNYHSPYFLGLKHILPSIVINKTTSEHERFENEMKEGASSNEGTFYNLLIAFNYYLIILAGLASSELPLRVENKLSSSQDKSRVSNYFWNPFTNSFSNTSGGREWRRISLWWSSNTTASRK